MKDQFAESALHVRAGCREPQGLPRTDTVKHAACFLRTARRDGRALAMFTLGSLLLGTGLSTAIALLTEARAHTSVAWLGMLFAGAGITMMLVFRPGRR